MHIIDDPNKRSIALRFRGRLLLVLGAPTSLNMKLGNAFSHFEDSLRFVIRMDGKRRRKFGLRTG